jgi:hypothetical protein
MVFIALKTITSNVAVVQLKLSDFMDDKPDVSKVIENALIKEKKIKTIKDKVRDFVCNTSVSLHKTT